jgi:hypothetical protein
MVPSPRPVPGSITFGVRVSLTWDAFNTHDTKAEIRIYTKHIHLSEKGGPKALMITTPMANRLLDVCCPNWTLASQDSSP